MAVTAPGRWARSVVLLVAASLLVGACGDDNTTPVADPPSSTEPGGSGELAEVGVGEALALVDGTRTAVRGHLFGQHGDTDAYVLCETSAESFPPQCGGDRLYVVDARAMEAQLDEAGVVLQQEGSASWSDGEVVLSGRREGPDGLAVSMPVPGPGAGEPTEPGGTVEVEVVDPDAADEVAVAPVVDEALELHTTVPHRAVLVAPDVLELHVWGGTYPCWALQSVEVSEDDETVTIAMLAGIPPEGIDAVCDAMAIEMSHTVSLASNLGDRTVLAIG